MAEEAFTRKNERPPYSKPFAAESNELKSGTMKEKYYSIPEYKNANELARTCMVYANSYAETMIMRLLQEEPDYFEDKPVGRHEFSIHLQNNICLPI